MATSTAIIATTTAVASTTAQLLDESPWVSYCVDIVFLLIFFYILLFTKPATKTGDNLTEEEKPNELEQVLRTDSEEPQEDDNKQTDDKETESNTESKKD